MADTLSLEEIAEVLEQSLTQSTIITVYMQYTHMKQQGVTRKEFLRLEEQRGILEDGGEQLVIQAMDLADSLDTVAKEIISSRGMTDE